MGYKDGLSFDIYVYALCENLRPESCKDLEKLAQDLHERIEMAIEDFINDSDNLNIDDYDNQY